jgi:Dna[CI] antecedent, DciA
MSKEPAAFSFQAEKLIASLRRVPDTTPERMKKRPTKELGGLVEDLLQKFQIGRESPEQTIRDHWAELVGPANAHYSHAVQIDPRGRLTVIAGHAVVRNELFHHRQLIVERIQKLAGCSQVRELNIRAG